MSEIELEYNCEGEAMLQQLKQKMEGPICEEFNNVIPVRGKKCVSFF